jgi:hypothetical protein
MKNSPRKFEFYFDSLKISSVAVIKARETRVSSKIMFADYLNHESNTLVESLIRREIKIKDQKMID